ncbi:MAG TPA: replication-associated recombination protein A, partial [Bacillota bacterium]|nr:replication-associated recombination protein A [Bacillota bacterium]
MENGTVILIGATTENPMFSVNKALLSRCRIVELVALSNADLKKILGQALRDRERGLGQFAVELEEGFL